MLHFRLLNDAEIAKSKRDFELKKAAYDVEVQTKKAEAELAYELQAAKTKQRIKDEQMQIKVVERTQEILVQVFKYKFWSLQIWFDTFPIPINPNFH